MKDKLPKLQFTKDGHIIMPAMLVDCSRRGLPQEQGNKSAGFQEGQDPPASGGEAQRLAETQGLREPTRILISSACSSG